MDRKYKFNYKSTINSIILLAGSFVFAFLLAEMVHEFGHYLAHLVYRTPGTGIHLDPFGGTRITGVISIPNKAMLVTTLAGPLSSLILGVATTLLLWQHRKPIFLALLLWGPVAMIQEGVNLSLGMLSPGSDAAWIAALLLPSGVVLGIGIILLIFGIIIIPLFLPLAGIQLDEPAPIRFGIMFVSMGSLMFIRFVYSALSVPGHTQENLYPLILTFLFSAVIVLLHCQMNQMVDKARPSTPLRIPVSAVIASWILGGGMFFFQVLMFN